MMWIPHMDRLGATLVQNISTMIFSDTFFSRFVSLAFSLLKLLLHMAYQVKQKVSLGQLEIICWADACWLLELIKFIWYACQEEILEVDLENRAKNVKSDIRPKNGADRCLMWPVTDFIQKEILCFCKKRFKQSASEDINVAFCWGIVQSFSLFLILNIFFRVIWSFLMRCWVGSGKRQSMRWELIRMNEPFFPRKDKNNHYCLTFS